MTFGTVPVTGANGTYIRWYKYFVVYDLLMLVHVRLSYGLLLHVVPGACLRLAEPYFWYGASLILRLLSVVLLLPFVVPLAHLVLLQGHVVQFNL